MSTIQVKKITPYFCILSFIGSMYFMTYLSKSNQTYDPDDSQPHERHYSFYGLGALSLCFIFIFIFVYGLQIQFIKQNTIEVLPNDYECMICMEKKEELFVKPDVCPCNNPSSHESCLSEWFIRSGSDKCPFCNIPIKNFESDNINFKYYCLEEDVGRFEIIVT